MPFTQLTLEDMDLIEKIIKFYIGDLWVRRYDLGETQLNSSESAQLLEIGNTLMGKTAYKTYSKTIRDLNKSEQPAAD